MSIFLQQQMRRRLVLATVAIMAGSVRATSFIPPGGTTTTVAAGDTKTIAAGEAFMVGRWNSVGAILNQTGGSITITGTWGTLGIGENPGGWGVYNMSGDAVFSATSLNGASASYSYNIVNQTGGSKMTMAGNAVASIGSLTFGSYGGSGRVELSGNASLTVGVMGYAGNYGFGSGYITFASGSTATLTITGKVLADYQAYVTAGSIRVDGVAQADFSKFQVSGNTLSLKVVPAKLAFTTQPGSGIAGSALTVQPVVKVQDAYGNTVATDTSTVTLSIGTNPGGGSLGGTFSRAAVAGVATFTDVSVSAAGSGYTLVAADGTLTSATSSTFNVSSAVGPPAKLAFTTQPGGGANHATWAQQPAVTLQDANGNTVTGTAQTVTLTIGNNPASGSLGGTTSVAVDLATGVATFSDLSIDKVGAGYTLVASGGPLTTATSGGFNITAGAAAKLAFKTQPGGGTAASAWLVQPEVWLQDAYDNTVTGTAQNVTLAIWNNAGPGGVLSGTATLAVNTGTGVATFTGLSIDKAGTGYTLTATGSSVSASPGTVVSAAFTIYPPRPTDVFTGGAYDGWDQRVLSAFRGLNVPTKLVFTTQPGNGSAGVALSVQPVVEVRDAADNVVLDDTSTVTIAIGTDPAGGSTLGGITQQVAVAGVATFSGLGIDKVGSGFTLVATDGMLTSATSSTFTVAAAFGPPAKLAFITQPGGGVNHAAWGQQPVVALQDADGNTVTGSAQVVSLAIQGNPAGGTLGGTTTASVNLGTGLATFSDLSIDKVGAGYTLVASGGAMTTATSSSFNITAGAAAKLAFTAQPGGAMSGWVWPAQPAVTLLDAYDNTVTGTVQNVTLAIQNNAGPGGVLGGTTTVAVNAGTGVATFGGLSIDKVGAGYTLTATGSTVSTSPGVVVSTAFDIADDLTIERFKGSSQDGWDRNAANIYRRVTALPGTTVLMFQ